MATRPTIDWHLVVPVKGGDGAKSRLRPPAGVDRAALAAAMARDTVTACTSGMPRGRVTVVTCDPEVRDWAAALGALVVPDPGSGLGAAVLTGLEAVIARLGALADAPEGARRVLSETSPAVEHEPASDPGARRVGLAVLLGDVPALRVADLEAALVAAERHTRAVVPDAQGSGTVLLASVLPDRPRPAFGPGSAVRHEELGHVRLDLNLPRLRTDVDVAADLRAAEALGLGAHTARVLGLPPAAAR